MYICHDTVTVTIITRMSGGKSWGVRGGKFTAREVKKDTASLISWLEIQYARYRDSPRGREAATKIAKTKAKVFNPGHLRQYQGF